jgi:acyl carrier protein
VLITLAAVNAWSLLRTGVIDWENVTVPELADNAVNDRVDRVVRKLLVKRGITQPIGRDGNLSEAGLSSLDIVNLMLAVEAEFDLKIPDREMVPANFRSMAHIEAVVSRLLG